MAREVIHIDVISDVICPWCFLGKRRLDKALKLIPEVKTQVIFRPYFLDPEIPVDGIDRTVYLTQKFGKERLTTLHKPLEEAGARDGVPYNFDKITRTPNTLDAHRLIRWAQQAGRQSDVVETLFLAYWRDGKDLGDKEVLSAIATASGLDGREIAILLNQETDRMEVLSEVQKAYQMGVRGVPTFVVNHRFGISGAQEAETLADTIRNISQQA